MAGDPSHLGLDGPAAWIPGYRAVLFSDGGRTSVVMLTATSDDEALEQATELAEGRAFEVWDALVRIGLYPPR